MAGLARTDLTTSQKVTLSAHAFIGKGRYGAITQLAQDFQLSRPTIYTTGAEAEEALPLEDGPLLNDFPAGVDAPEPEGRQAEHEVERGRVTLDGPPHHSTQPSDERRLRQEQDETTRVAEQAVPVTGCQDV